MANHSDFCCVAIPRVTSHCGMCPILPLKKWSKFRIRMLSKVEPALYIYWNCNCNFTKRIYCFLQLWIRPFARVWVMPGHWWNLLRPAYSISWTSMVNNRLNWPPVYTCRNKVDWWLAAKTAALSLCQLRKRWCCNCCISYGRACRNGHRIKCFLVIVDASTVCCVRRLLIHGKTFEWVEWMYDG